MKGKIISINISKKKGDVKVPVHSANIIDKGIEGDAHAEAGNRQISLMDVNRINQFAEKASIEIAMGSFGENLNIQGIDMASLHPLDKFIIDDVVLEITQIGKTCHNPNCSIFKQTGYCEMPQSGVFTRVLKQGHIKSGATITHKPKLIKIYVLTISTRAYQKIYKDKSGPLIVQMMKEHYKKTGRKVQIAHQIVPDDPPLIKQKVEFSAKNEIDLLITTGGTGVGTADFTYETIQPMLSKEIPGLPEYIRNKYAKNNLKALSSRSLAGFIGYMLLFSIPGSEKAVKEYVTELLKSIDHLTYMRHGLDIH